jgi:hypothetical protein
MITNTYTSTLKMDAGNLSQTLADYKEPYLSHIYRRDKNPTKANFSCA